MSQRSSRTDLCIGSNYTIGKEIGSGAYGSVYTAVYNPLLTTYAMKRYKNILKHSTLKQNTREIEILSMVRHPNIVQYIDLLPALDQTKDAYLVLEHLPCDLNKLLYSTAVFTPAKVKTMMYELLCAVNYIHSRKIVHRDIKPGNILLTARHDVKLCDFGLSRSLVGIGNFGYEEIYFRDYVGPQVPVIHEDDFAEGLDECATVNERTLPGHFTRDKKSPVVFDSGFAKQLTTHTTTRFYRAPEVILVEPYFTAVDMWGVGCVFAELLQMLERNKYRYYDRKPLFTGGSCFPLSPHDKEKCVGGGLQDANDQMHKIFRILGSPQEEDMMFITNCLAKQRLMNMPKYIPVAFDKLYPGIEPGEKELLEGMLKINPYNRLTAKQALQHKYFDSVRQKGKEIEGPPLSLESEGDDSKCIKLIERMYKKTNAYLYF